MKIYKHTPDFNFCRWILLNCIKSSNGIFIYNRNIYSGEELYGRYRCEVLNAVMNIFRVSFIDLKSKNKYTELLEARRLLYSMTDVTFCMNVIGMNRRTVEQYNKLPENSDLVDRVMRIITE